MVVQNQLQLGEGLAIPTDPHYTPTIIQPSTQPQKTQQPRKPKRKDTQVPQSSDPIENFADEAVHKELGDSLVRAATTASSLEVDSSGALGAQATMEITIAQTRFESVSKHSNDSLLARGNTLRSDEDRLKLDDLMALCTTLQNRVLDLEKQRPLNIMKLHLKRRVKKLEKKNSLGKDASKQWRIDAIDGDEEITMVSVQNVDEEMFDVNVLDGEEVFVAEQEVVVKDVNNEVNVVEEVVEVINSAKLINDDAQVSAATKTTSTITTVDDITLAQALMEIKDKGIGILIEPVKPIKKKDLIMLEEEAALNLQAEFDEEERLAREKAKKVEEANIA
ncbi:hypothetical protein Tco_1408624 [Tanacetum coccineum]